jgi:type IV secretory pathway ATPase VirB11/archaellum biosynthesis ATPase
MKVGLFDFQKDALYDLHDRLKRMRVHAAVENPQIVSFSSPTGSGKTIVMTAKYFFIFSAIKGGSGSFLDRAFILRLL